MISHKTSQREVPVKGSSFASPVARAGRRTGKVRLISTAEPAEARQNANGAMKRGQAERAAVSGNGPVSVERGEQDRREGPRFGAFPFPPDRPEARLWRALRGSLAGRAVARGGRAGPPGCLREEDSAGRPVLSGRGRHVVSFLRGRGVPVAGPGRAHHRHGFPPGAYRHLDGSRLRRERTLLPDVGAGAACPPQGGSARTASQSEAKGSGLDRRTGMMTGPGRDNPAGGGPARHIPVLLDEVLEALSPHAGQTFVDGTFGAGGYTRAILARGASVIAIDRDPGAIAAGRELEGESGGRLRLMEGRFSELDILAGEPVDGVVLDIGVSSMQLDEAERGFPFRQDGPLDMRRSRSGVSADDVVNRRPLSDLTRIFGLLGEERHAGRIARMIEKRRTERPFERTLDLANAIEKLVGR